MAGISKNLATGNFWNRLVLSRAAAAGSGSGGGALTGTAFRRNMHEIVYEKNIDDQLNPTLVPEEAIKPESDKYWAPNPKTGVFGPEPGTEPGSVGSSAAATSQGSVMGETAWFRPTSLEDAEKSP